MGSPLKLLSTLSFPGLSSMIMTVSPEGRLVLALDGNVVTAEDKMGKLEVVKRIEIDTNNSGLGGSSVAVGKGEVFWTGQANSAISGKSF